MQRQILRQVPRVQANAFVGQPLSRPFATQAREFAPTVKSSAFTTFNTGKLSDVAESGTADIDAAVAAARAAFDGPWPTMSAQDRGKLVYRLAELHIDDLAALEALSSTITNANAQLHHV
jgi:aldehyde dehydrogenase (NAD+)